MRLCGSLAPLPGGGPPRRQLREILTVKVDLIAQGAGTVKQIEPLTRAVAAVSMKFLKSTNGVAMRLTESQIRRVAGVLVRALSDQAGVSFKAPAEKIQSRIEAIIRVNLEEEQALETEAQRLLAAQVKNAPAGIDQHRLLQMIKKKLAEDRGIPL